MPAIEDTKHQQESAVSNTCSNCECLQKRLDYITAICVQSKTVEASAHVQDTNNTVCIHTHTNTQTHKHTHTHTHTQNPSTRTQMSTGRLREMTENSTQEIQK